jgi:lipoprotein-releasing system ATP-binding protein
LLALVRNEGVAALVATHNTDLAVQMDRTLLLDKGRLSANKVD